MPDRIVPVCNHPHPEDPSGKGNETENRAETENNVSDITLEDNVALLKQVQKIAKVGYWVYEASTDELKWSPEVYDIFGIESKEHGTETYESFLSFVHPDDVQRVWEAYDRHVRLQEPYELTHRILTGDGTEKHVQERCETHFDTEGLPIRSVGVVADITEVKRTQEELQQLFDTMAQGVVYQDETGRIFRANPAALQLLGLSLDQIEGRTSFDPAWYAIREDGSPLPGCEHPAMVALKTGTPVSGVVMGVYHPENNDYVWLLVSAKPQFRAGQNSPYQVYTSFADVTEQKHTADALRLSHEIFEQAGSIARIGSWNLNPATGTLQMSDVSRKIHELDDGVNLGLEEALAFFREGRTRETIRMAVEDCRQNGGGFDLELEFVGAKGTPRWVRTTGRAVLVAPGCTRLVGTIQDITPQRRAYEELRRQTRLQEMLMKISATYINLPLEHLEEAIQHSLEELGHFVEADRFYVFSYDFVRNSCCNTHEWCEEGIEPMIQELQHSSLDGIQDWVDTHLRGEVMNVADVPALPADNRLREILEPQGIKSIITMPLMDQGKCIGFIGLDSVRKHHVYSEVERKLLTVFSEMLVNVRKRMEALNALREHRQFLSQIIENSGSLIYTKDVNGAYLSANQRWCEVTGCPLVQALGKTDRELFLEKTADSFMENDRKALASSQPCEMEESIEGAGGIRHFLTVKFAIRDHEGNVTGVAGMSTDITERKRAEVDRLAKESAEAENQAKSAFLAKISHEILTPMNSIIGFANLLEREQGLGDSQRRQIQNISRSGEHLLGMINEILDLSKMEAGRMHVVMQDFNPRDMVLDLAGMFEYRAAAKGLAFRVDEVELLPGSIRSDPSKIRQILINLIGNAVKFTPEGWVALRMRVKRRVLADRREDVLSIEVEDTGPGIPREDLPRLYDVFYQGRLGLEMGGTGLGLSITRSLVELLGGEITLDSEVGAGSLFRVEVPVQISINSQASRHPSRRSVSGILADREPYRILVADGQAGNCEYLRDVLQPAGFTVACVDTAQALAECLPGFRPDAVLLNMQMPLLDGLATLFHMKDGSPACGIPVIAVGEDQMLPETHPDLCTLSRAVLRRPVLPDDVFDVLAEVLGIEYVYEPSSHLNPQQPLEPGYLREDASAMPANMRETLVESVEMGDMRRFELELSHVVARYPRLGATLRARAATYDYPGILGLLSQKETE
jgi:PAS domain S-box-containing protein